MKRADMVMIVLFLIAGMGAGCAGPGAEWNHEGQTEKIKIEIMAKSWKGGGWPDNYHPIIQYINKKFNVDLQIQWVPNANFAEKMDVVFASGKIPDVMRIDPSIFLKWSKQDAFIDLQPYLSKYPNLQSIAQPDEWSLLNPPGKIYGIPIYETAQNSVYVRSDWLDSLGIPIPADSEFTLDKFYEIAKAFAAQDPDKNGKQDTYGFSALGNSLKLGVPQLEAAFGLANGWKEQNGELVPMQIQAAEWTSFLSFMRKAYDEGVLDPNFLTNRTFNDIYSMGKIGFAIDMHYQFSQQTNQQLQMIEPKGKFIELSPPIGPNGLRGTKTPVSGMTKVVLSKKMDAIKRDRILELFDWWVSPDGEDILKNGIEGVHYERHGDGYKMTDALAAEGEGRQSLLWNWVLRNQTNTFNIYKWSDPVWAQEMKQSIENAAKYPYKDASEGYSAFSATYMEKGGGLDIRFLQTVLEIIVGKKPVESINDAIAEWRKNGGDQIIMEVNAAYKAAKSSNPVK